MRLVEYNFGKIKFAYVYHYLDNRLSYIEKPQYMIELSTVFRHDDFVMSICLLKNELVLVNKVLLKNVI